jgi:hypothetical protein
MFTMCQYGVSDEAKEPACRHLLILPAHVLGKIVELVDGQDKLNLLSCCKSFQEPVLCQLKGFAFYLGDTSELRVAAASLGALQRAVGHLSVSMHPQCGKLQAAAVVTLLEALEECPAVTELVLRVRGPVDRTPADWAHSY